MAAMIKVISAAVMLLLLKLTAVLGQYYMPIPVPVPVPQYGYGGYAAGGLPYGGYSQGYGSPIGGYSRTSVFERRGGILGK